MTIPIPSLNQLLLPLCFFVMLACPAVSVASNQQLTRLCVISGIMLLVRKNHSFKLESHHWLFMIWVMWTGLGGIFSEYPQQSFYGYYPYRGMGFLTWIIIASFGILYWKVYKTIVPLAVTCLICLIALIIGHYFIVTRWQGHFGNIEHSYTYFQQFFLPEVAAASFSSTCAPLLAIFSPWLCIVALLPILDAASRSGLIALSIWTSFPLYTWIKDRMSIERLMFGLCTLSLILLLSPFWFKMLHVADKLKKVPDITKVEQGPRLQWANQASRLASALPLTGFGIDTLSNYIDTPTGLENTNLRRFIADDTHSIVWNVILTTGWIGAGILLFSLLMACRVVHAFPNEQNLICFCVIGSFLCYGLFNPHPLISNIIVVIALFGIRSNEKTKNGE